MRQLIAKLPFRLLCLLVFAACAACALAQVMPSPAPTGNFTVSGVVLNSATGQPVSRALVALGGVGGQQAFGTFSGSDGSFRIGGVPSGDFMIGAAKPGFNTRGSGPSERLHITADVSSTLKITPEAVVAGHVEDPEHDPIVGAFVSIQQFSVRQGKRQAESVGEAETDGEGNFRAAGLPAGEYLILVAPNGDVAAAPSSSKNRGDWGFGYSYYPGVDSIHSATPIHLTEGQSAEIAFTLKPQPIFHVSGVVNGNRSTTPVEVTFSRPEFPLVNRWVQTTLATGRFTVFNLSGATYLAQASAFDGERQLRAQQELTIGSDMQDLQFALMPPASIPLNVHFPDLAASQTHVRQAISVTLDSDIPGGENAYGGTWMENPETAKIDNVWPGSYWLRVSSYTGLRVQSARFGSIDLMQEKLVVGSTPPSDPIEIVLADDSGSVNIAVPAGVRCSAVLLPLSYAALQPIVSGLPSGAGKVTIPNVPPGDYYAVLIEEGNDVAYAESAFIRANEAKLMRVTVPPKGSVSAGAQVLRRGQ